MSPLPPGAPSRFDLVLVVIAVAMVLSVATAWLSAVSLRIASSAGAVVSYTAMFYGLARDPPTA